MKVLFFLIGCVYFMIPAFMANIVPILAKRFNFLNCLAKPIDCGCKFLGEPLLGPHKTFRGFILGTIVAIIFTWFQYFLFNISFFREISLIDYSATNIILLGFILGFGSLIGDSIGSFIKRRHKKKSGAFWMPGDQISLAMGVFIFLPIVFVPSVEFVISVVVFTFMFHILGSKIASYLKIREEKY